MNILSPERLDAMPEPLAELSRELELTVLKDLCTRFASFDQLNEVTVQDIRVLRSHGIDLDEITAAIQKFSGISQEKMNKLLDDVVKSNQQYYTELIDLARITMPEKLVDEADIEAIRMQTNAEFKDLTRSMAFVIRANGQDYPLKPREAFEWALDNATLQIQSGAVSYNQAIANAVRQLADSGLKTAIYTGGRYENIDVVARRAVMTAINALNQKYREQSMEYLGTNLVETTAHFGARNIQKPGEPDFVAHTNWQGKVFAWNKRN